MLDSEEKKFVDEQSKLRSTVDIVDCFVIAECLDRSSRGLTMGWEQIMELKVSYRRQIDEYRATK